MPIDSTSLPKLSQHFLTSFIVHEQIGAGGFGVCYKVSPRSDLSQTFAVKLIVKSLLNPVDRLLKTRSWGPNNSGGIGLERVEGGWVVPVEAWVMKNANNDGAVGYVDLFADDKLFYLVMDYHGTNWAEQHAPVAEVSLPPSPPLTPTDKQTQQPTHALSIPPPPAPMMRQSSSDLFDCIEAHAAFDESVARHVFGQVLSTVVRLARRGIAHCDIKDENIVVDADFNVKLVDFGSAYLFDPALAERAVHTTPFAGSATYAPPEVFDDPNNYPLLVGEVWAMGVLLNILLTGHSPFSTRECQRIGRRLKKKGWSEEVERVLAGCLRVDPKERWTLRQLCESEWLAGELR